MSADANTIKTTSPRHFMLNRTKAPFENHML